MKTIYLSYRIKLITKSIKDISTFKTYSGMTCLKPSELPSQTHTIPKSVLYLGMFVCRYNTMYACSSSIHIPHIRTTGAPLLQAQHHAIYVDHAAIW